MAKIERAPDHVPAPEPVTVGIVYQHPGSRLVDREVEYLGYRRDGKQMRLLILRGVGSKRSFTVAVDAVKSLSKDGRRHFPVSSMWQWHNLAREFHAFALGEPIPQDVIDRSTRR